jgi:ribosomal protein S18 acetylase RimI-like enzyme
LKPLWLALHEHHQAIAPELQPYVSRQRSWAARRALYEELIAAGGVAICAHIADALVGYSVNAPEPTHWSATFASAERLTDLVTLAVHPDYRGRGIGTALLDRGDSDAVARGEYDAVLGVFPQNGRAIDLYRRRGYVPAWLLMTRFGRPGPVPTSDPEAAPEPVAAHEIDALQPLWLSLHHHHQSVAPHLAPFVNDELSWREMRRRFTAAADLGCLWRVGSASDPAGFIRFGIADQEILADTWATGARVGEIHVLVVAESFRNRGVGSALLDAADRRLAQLGAVDQMISAIEPNVGAIRMYARRGFRPAWLNMTRFRGRPV